jgi:hypothetical protein
LDASPGRDARSNGFSDNQRDVDEARTVIIGLVAILTSFKIITSLLILYFFPSWEAVILVLGLSALWIYIGIWWGGLHSALRLRLVRARIRRNELIRQEWQLDEREAARRR